MSRPHLEPEWLVNGLLLESGTSLVASKPKVGKSSFARCLAAAVSRGADFLGRKVKKTSVVYLSLEDSERIVQSHFKALGCNAGISFFFGMPPQNATSKLQRLISLKTPGLVVVDTLARFTWLRDFKDYGEVSRVMQQFQELARKGNCHLMLLHHSPKIGPGGIDAAIGSVAFSGGVDTFIELTQNRGQRTVATRQRFGDDLEPTALLFDKTSKQIDAGLPIEVVEEKRLRTEILSILPASSPGKTEQELAKEITGDTGAKSRVLRLLVLGGHVLREGYGKKGDPYRYFRANP
jgi:hypothetical protein